MRTISQPALALLAALLAILAAVIALFLTPAPARGGEPAGQKLVRTIDPPPTNGTPYLRIEGKTITPDAPAWSLRQVPLAGGKQEGATLLVLDNGKLTITLIPVRGMGILSVKAGDFRLGWDSPVTDVVHPKFMNLTARGGLGWLEGFNEWLCRCGLENVGAPHKDTIITNTGARAEVDLTLHGKIANIPAANVEVEVERKPPYRITVRGRVVESMLFGPNLELTTELSTEPGADTFRLRDAVRNRGAAPQDFQLLYHVNYGKPLLEDGSRLHVPLAEVTPVNDRAAADLKRFGEFACPTLGFVEQVYLLKPLPDREGKVTTLLTNKSGDRGASIHYSLKELPYLTLWKNTGAVEDGYVVGIEPGTCYPTGRRNERAEGRVSTVAAGQSYTMTLDFGLHVGADAVRAVADGINAVQGGRGPEFRPVPAKR